MHVCITVLLTDSRYTILQGPGNSPLGHVYWTYCTFISTLSRYAQYQSRWQTDSRRMGSQIIFIFINNGTAYQLHQYNGIKTKLCEILATLGFFQLWKHFRYLVDHFCRRIVNTLYYFWNYPLKNLSFQGSRWEDSKRMSKGYIVKFFRLPSFAIRLLSVLGLPLRALKIPPLMK